MTIRARNFLLTLACLALVAFALRLEGLSDTTRTATIAAAFAFITGLWMRSSRGAAGFLLPLACAAQLVYGCNDGWRYHGPELERTPALRPQFAASHIALTTQASNPVPTGQAGLYAKNSDAYPRLVDTAGIEYIAGTAWRLRQNAGAPGTPAEGDVWYDSTAHAFVYRDNSGNVTLANAGSYVALTGTQNVGGAKTFTSAANFTGGLSIGSAVQSGASFLKVCTITSAAASTPIVCLLAADVPASASAKLATWHAYVNGATGWATTATCVIEDTAGNDLVSIAVAALTANTFVDDGTANVTPAARYRLGTGGAADAGLQVSCNANGTGSDLVFVLSGSIQ